MNNYVKLAVALGVLSLLGIVIAVLLVSTGPESKRIGSSAVLHESSAAPICSSALGGSAAFYADMATVNLRMHERMGIQPSDNADRDFARIMIPHHEGRLRWRVSC